MPTKSSLKKKKDIKNKQNGIAKKARNDDEVGKLGSDNEEYDPRFSDDSALNGIEEDDNANNEAEKESFFQKIFHKHVNKDESYKEQYSNIPNSMLNTDLVDTLEKDNEENKKSKDSKDKDKETVKTKNAITGKSHKKLSPLSKNSKFKKNIIDLLGYKTLTQDRNHYLVLADEDNKTSGLAEILKVGGAGIGGLSDDMKRNIAINFIKFLRMNSNEIGFVSLPIPNDTKAQQRNWEKLYFNLQQQLVNNDYSKDEREQKVERLKYIKENIARFKEVELNLINQGSFMIIYQDLAQSTPDADTGRMRSAFKQTVLNLNKKVTQCLNLDNNYPSLTLSKISPKEKEKLLKRINNPRNIV
ncbi:hypothetical protein DY052_06290 [Apilactobacillus timberlakei]|uniref:hypothetical protein n=1 Tax=Apilactobacillus timberlakei TaxID=2008380 RepID=UPI00112B80F3|nr:hypothetical protein [Apilactobacillus timberlakei]TPR15033.1 hypothetical protein DY052_06290 [Apilactobacillus timberlakei]